LSDSSAIPPLEHKPPSPQKYQEGQPVTPRLVHVIINPAAGQEQPILGLLNSLFRENEIAWEVFITQEAGDARRFAQESVRAGADVVMACGGDGTVMETASGLRGSSVPLAILPCGTANVMSIELAIPADLRQAIALVAQGQNVVRGIDMGLINGVEFLLRVGVGAEARMVIETPRESKTRWGNLAYFVTALNQLQNPDVSRYIMNLDGLHIEVDGISLMIANSVSIGVPGIHLVQNTSVSDGLLDVIVIRRADLPSMMAIATNTLLNLAEEPEPVLHWQAREIRIQAVPPQPVQVDGEVISGTDLTMQVLPKAVNILCPPPPPIDTTSQEP
jgi:diacylglycerol kinase (ATP)